VSAEVCEERNNLLIGKILIKIITPIALTPTTCFDEKIIEEEDECPLYLLKYRLLRRKICVS